MTSTSSTEPLHARSPRAKKRFGQHFLSDRNILRRIVDAAELSPGETVLEIGPGRGELTAELASRGARVVAVEVDRDLVAALRRRFAGSKEVAIIERDVLASTPRELLAFGGAAPPYSVVANLAYNIAAPALRLLLESEAPPRRLVVMVQREVAEAMVARPGNMRLMSVATQVYGEPRLVMRVAPGAFSPPPAVRSAVVRIDVAPRPRVNVPLEAFFRVARAGFASPRKQLRNGLASGLGTSQQAAEQILATAGIDSARRPQTLALDEWAAVTRAWLPSAGR